MDTGSEEIQPQDSARLTDCTAIVAAGAGCAVRSALSESLLAIPLAGLAAPVRNSASNCARTLFADPAAQQVLVVIHDRDRGEYADHGDGNHQFAQGESEASLHFPHLANVAGHSAKSRKAPAEVRLKRLLA